MDLFSKCVLPDLFIAFTDNLKQPEIISSLNPGDKVEYHADIVDHVFYLKLEALIDDLTIKNILGKCISYCYSIKFQKYGLPHAHILITLYKQINY